MNDHSAEETSLRDLIREGLTAAEAIDYYFVKIKGMSQTQWAAERGTGQSAISQNVNKARRKLS